MKNKVALYFIFLVHLITLSINIHFNNLIKNIYNKDISFVKVNEFLIKKKINLAINDQNINLISIIYLISFFIIGLKNKNLFIYLILSFILIDGTIYYSEKKTNIFINLGFAIIGYIFGIYFNNRNYNYLLAKNKIESDEESEEI